MSFEGNAAMKLPEQPVEKSNKELLRELQRKQNTPQSGEVWSEEDREKLLELEKEIAAGEEPFTDMQKAHLKELRRIQTGGERPFTPDEVSLFDFLTAQEEKEKRA